MKKLLLAGLFCITSTSLVVAQQDCTFDAIQKRHAKCIQNLRTCSNDDLFRLQAELKSYQESVLDSKKPGAVWQLIGLGLMIHSGFNYNAGELVAGGCAYALGCFGRTDAKEKYSKEIEATALKDSVKIESDARKTESELCSTCVKKWRS